LPGFAFIVVCWFTGRFFFLAFISRGRMAQQQMMRAAVVVALLVSQAAAFQGAQLPLYGIKRVSAQRSSGAAIAACSAAGSDTPQLALISRRSTLYTGLALLGVTGLPSAVSAKDKTQGAKTTEPEKTFKTISLDDFYAALEDQEVLKVEFDGAKFEVCFNGALYHATYVTSSDLFFCGVFLSLRLLVTVPSPQACCAAA
jgi:hypothetical protein